MLVHLPEIGSPLVALMPLWSLPQVIEVGKKERKKKKKTMQAAKSSSHQLRKKGPLGKKSPSTRKGESSQRGSGGLRADKPVVGKVYLPEIQIAYRR